MFGNNGWWWSARGLRLSLLLFLRFPLLRRLRNAPPSGSDILRAQSSCGRGRRRGWCHRATGARERRRLPTKLGMLAYVGELEGIMHTTLDQTRHLDRTCFSCQEDTPFHWWSTRVRRTANETKTLYAYCWRALLSSLNFPTSLRSMRTSEDRALLKSSRY
jgi:hypothetical protein